MQEMAREYKEDLRWADFHLLPMFVELIGHSPAAEPFVFQEIPQNPEVRVLQPVNGR
jgi:hypothetical protein